MIELFKGKKYQYNEIIDILSSANVEEFYFTENNQRFFVNTREHFKKLLSQSHSCYYVNDDSINNKGVILVWRSKTNDLVRRYVKVAANTPQTAKNLLNLLLWAYPQELYTKIKKNSPYAYVFKGKGFKFEGDRGTEILLKRMKSLPRADFSKTKDSEE
jgi:hypothetical protein